MCIFCASRLYFPPPLSVVPRARSLYPQRRTLQSSARARKPAAAAAAPQGKGEQEEIISRPSSTPIHSALRPTSLKWTMLAESSKIPISPGVTPAKLSWDGWSATLEGGSQPQAQSGVAPQQKQNTTTVETESNYSDTTAHELKDGAATKVCGRSGRSKKKHRG